MRLIHPLLCVAALAGASCATSSAAAGGDPGTCRSDLPPGPLPLAAAVDSAGLHRQLADVLAPGQGRVLARFVPAPGLDPDSVSVLSASLADQDLARVREAVAEAALPAGSDAGEVHLLLRDEGGMALRRVAGFAGCAPVMTEVERVRQTMQEESRGLGRVLTDPTTVTVLVFVEADGRVGDVRIQRGSGITDVDLAAARVARQLVFVPAQVEGVPLPVWSAIPLSFGPPQR